MYTSRTPYRISFFGGGTDYKGWYEKNGGSFISMGINKYCYLNIRELPPFFDYNCRIVWSKIEQVKSIEDIQHPAIKVGLKIEGVDNIELHHMGDLPARSGLGSSSSFSVGLLHVLRRFRGLDVDRYSLAKDAIHLERVLLKEAGGIQDQIAASFGGLNFVKIEKNGEFKVNPINLCDETREKFEKSLLLVFTGIFRDSFQLAKEHESNSLKSFEQLGKISDITSEAMSLFEKNDFIRDFGDLLNETWQAKKIFNNKISNTVIDEIYETAMRSGAYGGKLMGAGAGGFMIFVIPPDKLRDVKVSLRRLVTASVKIDFGGTQAYQSNGGEFI